MELKRIRKTIDINAPKDKVWNVLLDGKYTQQWFSAFGEGIQAKTDWKEGGSVTFSDRDGNGMTGIVKSNKTAELLDIQYERFLKNGVEDKDSEEAMISAGGHEIYRLNGTDGRTTLQIESDMASQHFDSMSLAWDKALEKIKELSEK
jgi:uncharacterized protein YndB with AHSA1/START domain